MNPSPCAQNHHGLMRPAYIYSLPYCTWHALGGIMQLGGQLLSATSDDEDSTSSKRRRRNIVRLTGRREGSARVRSRAVKNRAISNRFCVAALRGGEQSNKNDQPVTRATFAAWAPTRRPQCRSSFRPYPTRTRNWPARLPLRWNVLGSEMPSSLRKSIDRARRSNRPTP